MKDKKENNNAHHGYLSILKGNQRRLQSAKCRIKFTKSEKEAACE